MMRLFAAFIVAVAAAQMFGSVQAAELTPDCTNPAVNEYFRTQIVNARTSDGKPLAEGVQLKPIGTMRPVAQNGADITCRINIRVTVASGSSAERSTTVTMTVKDGEIQNLDFMMAPNR